MTNEATRDDHSESEYSDEIWNRDSRGRFGKGNRGGYGSEQSMPTPEQCRLARKVCQLGATDAELAAILDIHPLTLKKWMNLSEDFSLACRIGGDMADARIERGLYNRAAGTVRRGFREAVTKQGDVVQLEWEEEIPTDVAAATRWLELRKSKDWGLKSKREEEGTFEVKDPVSQLEALVGRYKRVVTETAVTPLPEPAESEAPAIPSTDAEAGE